MKSMFSSCRSGLLHAGVVLSLIGICGQAHALSFDIPTGDSAVEGVLNTTITAGASIRMQGRSSNLIGKANNNPNVCNGQQSCQGLFKNQSTPAKTLAAAPGLFGSNNDDGDLNYNKYDLTSAVAKVTQDISLKYGDFGFFAKALYFYDAINNNFTEYHPNRITPDNLATSGRLSSTVPVAVPNLQGLPITIPAVVNQRVYGTGQVVRNRRNGSETLDQIGSNLQFLDTYFYGKLPLPFEKELSFKIGRQLVNWGESTLLAINSINQANPINANNFFRTGFQVEEVFIPINMAFLSFQPVEGLTVESFYQLEWKPLEAPAAGSYLSNNDVVGTDNATRTATIDFGGGAEAPYLVNGHGINYPLDNPLNGVTDTSTTIERLPDHTPRTGGQFGVAFKYYANWLNNGTELGFYFMNYHSRLPYASTFATDASCARREGNAMHNDATDPVSFLQDCPSLPLLKGTPAYTTNSVGRASSNAVPLDTAKLLIEYPEDIHLFGLSFNTTFGDISMQGEVAYRPNAPLQIAPADLVFAAFGPTLSRCHNYNCQGTTGATADTLQGFGSSDTRTTGGNNCAQTNGTSASANAAANGCDTFSLGIGHAPGSARSFPNFVIPYRGGTVGENAPTDRSKPYDENNPGYIRGFERFKTLQYNLGATSVLGATDRLPVIFGADQILLLFEVGATHVPGMPALDVLQIAGPGVEPHASAGADGSGANGSQQACGKTPSGNPCVVGPDGLRFNPHQANLNDFATKFSWGYDIIALIRYESLLPGISLQPQITFKQDISGIAPGPGENFIEGRKIFDILLETRYKSFLSLNLGYTWNTGGGINNLLADRDQMRAFAKYQF